MIDGRALMHKRQRSRLMRRINAASDRFNNDMHQHWGVMLRMMLHMYDGVYSSADARERRTRTDLIRLKGASIRDRVKWARKQNYGLEPLAVQEAWPQRSQVETDPDPFMAEARRLAGAEGSPGQD